MKQTLLFMAFALIVTIVIGQETFTKQYALIGGLNNYGSEILYTPQTTIIEGRAYFKKTDNYALYTHQLDSNGNIVKTKLYGPDTSMKVPIGNVAGKLTNDNFLVFFTSDGYLFKSSVNGEIAWSKRLKSKNYRSWYYPLIGEASDGNYLLAGNVDDNDSDKVQLIKINKKTGDLMWFKTIVTDVTYLVSWTPQNIATTSNGDIYLEGAFGCGLCESTSPDFIVLNSEGKIKSYQHLLTTFGTSIYAKQLIAKNNRVYAYCTVNSTEQLLINISDTSSERYGSTMASSSIFSIQKYLSAHKNFLPLQLNGLTVFKKDGSFIQKAYLNDEITQYDRLGRTCDEYVIPKTDTTTIQKLFEFSNPEYYLTIDSLYLTNIAVYSHDGLSKEKTLCEGTASGKISNAETNKMKTVEHLNIKLYPNPANANLTITGLSNKSTTKLQIINVNGNIIKEATTLSSTHTLNIQSLNSGAYLIRISDGGEVIIRTFIKQ